MTLLSGIRNLIGRKRVPAAQPPEISPPPVEIETGLREEIEAKPPVTVPVPEMVVADVDDDVDDVDEAADASDVDDIVDIDDLDDFEELDEIDIGERLDEMETRLGAGGADIHRLVKELDTHVETNATRSADLVKQLDERIQSQARQLDARFDHVADESKRLAEQVERLPALADEIAGINQQCNRLLELIDDTAKAVSHADERFESVINDLRHLQGRMAGLDDAITRIGQSIKNLETTFPAVLDRTRKSMLLFVFACMGLAVLALAAAVTSMFV